MAARLCLLLLFGCPSPATPGGLGVRQHPQTLSVMRGATATLSCHFKVESLKYGVQWFKMKSEKQLLPESPRHIVVEENQTSSLVITEVALGDSGRYYCELNVLQKDPERGDGTELVVLAPPSAPLIYLRTPADQESGPWALYCLTGGFHPSNLTITWTHLSAAADIDHLSVTSCTLPAIDHRSGLSGGHADRTLLAWGWPVNSEPPNQPQCFGITDAASGDVFLISAVHLPEKKSLHAGITLTCTVHGHPAITSPLNASFSWDAAPNHLILHLNILKLCFLSATLVVFSLEAVKRLCLQGK